MGTDRSDFEQLQRALAAGGIDGLLETLAARLAARKQYHELFEALKMRVRCRLRLPLRHGEGVDVLDAEQRAALEDGLLEACRHVGLLLLREGCVRDGWMYLRAVGDRAAVARELAALDVQEERLEELVEVLFHEGVDPPRGLALILRHYGTCDAITALDSSWNRLRTSEQQAAVRLLVEHVHRELTGAVVAHICRTEGCEPRAATLRQLVEQRPWLFENGGYHLDTTHLAAAVRLARVLAEPEALCLAWDLTFYGARLDPQFQFSEEEPFAETYPAHSLFFGALLGERVEEAVEYFRQQAASAPLEPGASLPWEIYVQLLDRLGRTGDAFDALLAYAGRQPHPSRWVPSLLELAGKAGRHHELETFCRQQDDLLGFAAGLAESWLNGPSIPANR
jgi:hypothetical protein